MQYRPIAPSSFDVIISIFHSSLLFGILQSRDYTERGIATASRLSVCLLVRDVELIVITELGILLK